jgi:DUF4097 and DUF4098 domain-containing protein YvlB
MKKILIAFWLLTSLAMGQQEYNLEHSQSADKVDKVRIDCPQGRIYFEPSSTKEINAYVKKMIYLRDEKEAKELADDIKVDFIEDNRTFEINVDIPRSRFPGKRFFSGIYEGSHSDYEIMIKVQLPAGINVDVKTSSADLSIADLKDNDFEVNGSSSDITIEDCAGDYSINVSSGDVKGHTIEGNLNMSGSSSDYELSEIKGDIKISTSSGDGMIEKAYGDVNLRSSSGDLRIYNIEGNLGVESTSGDIIAENISGSIDGESTSGTIKLRHLTNIEGRFRTHSTSGDVLMEIARGFGGEVRIETVSGDIDSRIDVITRRLSDDYLTGEIGKGVGEIIIETTSGDITLESF